MDSFRDTKYYPYKKTLEKEYVMGTERIKKEGSAHKQTMIIDRHIKLIALIMCTVWNNEFGRFFNAESALVYML